MNEHIIWNEFGTLHSNAGSYPDAIAAYRRAIDYNDKFTDAMQNLAHAYMQTGDLAQAAKTYLGCIETTADSKEKFGLWNQLGDLYMQMDNAREAQVAYQKASAIEKVDLVDTQQYADVFSGKESEAEANLSPSSRLDIGLASASEESAPPEQSLFAQLKPEQIHVNPKQPRARIGVRGLVESVREHGIIQPLIVSPNGEEGHYILISGERRLEAAREVGLNTVPAIIREVSEQERLELALIENVQRLNLSSLEQAEAYTQLRDEFNLSPEEIARKMGKSSVAVRNMLRQLELPAKIRRALDAGRISEEHTRALLGLQNASRQLMVLEQILSHDLSVRRTEALVRTLASGEAKSQDNESKPQVESVPQELSTPEPVAVIEDVEERVADEAPLPIQEFSDDQEVALFYLDESDVDRPGTDQALLLDIEIAPERDEEPIETELLLPQTASFEKGEQSYSEEEVRNRIITFESVTAQNPQNDKAWSRLGKHYALVGENENAIEAYVRALALLPNNGDYHYQLGLVYSTEERYIDAIESFKHALLLEEDEIIIHCALASNYRRMEMHENAEEHIAAVAERMEHESAYNRACFESICGNTIKAVELLQSALHLKEATVEKIQNDPDFDFIRHENPFAELISEVANNAPITSL